MNHPKTKLLVGIFILISLLDTVTTLIVKFKQPAFNETNPIYLLTGSIYLMLLCKFIVVFFISLFFLKWYSKPPIYARYLMIVYILILTFGQLTASFSNISASNLEPEKTIEIAQQYTTEMKMEYYKESYTEVPRYSIVSFFIILFIIFATWWEIEKEWFYS